MRLSVRKECWDLREPITISHSTMTLAEAVVVELHDGEHSGRGEANPFRRYNQTADSVIEEIETFRSVVEAGVSIETLQSIIPAGSARNAIDCALWDLSAKRAGKRIWDLVGLGEPHELAGNITIGLDTCVEMRRKAKEYSKRFSMIKIKLGKEEPLACVEAVRDGAPGARLLVDVNEAWQMVELIEFAPRLHALGVELIEQPLQRGQDHSLIDYKSPVPLCADESCFDRSDLDYLSGRYDFINIKLDKTGGFTEALHLAQEAREKGFRIMVGCMAGTSLAMAPGFVISALGEYRDLDGPLLLRNDRREFPLLFINGMIQPFPPELWG